MDQEIKLPINYAILRDMANNFKVRDVNIIDVVFQHVKQDLKHNNLKPHEEYFQMLQRKNDYYMLLLIYQIFTALVYFQTGQFWKFPILNYDIKQGDVLRYLANLDSVDGQDYSHLICIIGCDYGRDQGLFYDEESNKLTKRAIKSNNQYEVLKPINI